jgi:Na+(H+)/acetate symporter ActP
VKLGAGVQEGEALGELDGVSVGVLEAVGLAEAVQVALGLELESS